MTITSLCKYSFVSTMKNNWLLGKRKVKVRKTSNRKWFLRFHFKGRFFQIIFFTIFILRECEERKRREEKSFGYKQLKTNAIADNYHRVSIFSTCFWMKRFVNIINCGCIIYKSSSRAFLMFQTFVPPRMCCQKQMHWIHNHFCLE